MIETPHTYAEWAQLIEKFKQREEIEDVLAAMKAGTIEWQTGVAERFTNRLLDAANCRMNAASDKFQKDLGRSAGKDSAIVQALIALRRELNYVVSALNLPAIPNERRKEFVNLVVEKANEIQKSLEDSAKKDRTGKLASLVRNNKVNTFEEHNL